MRTTIPHFAAEPNHMIHATSLNNLPGETLSSTNIYDSELVGLAGSMNRLLFFFFCVKHQVPKSHSTYESPLLFLSFSNCAFNFTVSETLLLQGFFLS